jgi:hypothetical protein
MGASMRRHNFRHIWSRTGRLVLIGALLPLCVACAAFPGKGADSSGTGSGGSGHGDGNGKFYGGLSGGYSGLGGGSVQP